MSPKLFNPPRVATKTQGWAGGINIRDAVNQLAANEARLLENMILDERGGATKRKGCTSHGTFGTGTDRGLSSYTFYRPGSAPQVLLYTSAGKLYYTNDPAAGTITWTQIATGLSTTVPFSFETFLGKVYMGNGVDSYASWDGSTYTTFGSAPKGKYHRLWKDTMWISGITGNPDRVYSSAPGDAETFPAAAWVDIAKGDGDAVTALNSDGQFLIVGKRDRTFSIYDPVTFSNRVVDFEKGFESHFAVAQFEGDIFFLSRRGICRYLGDSPSQVISAKIDPLFSDSILALDQLWQSTVYVFGNRIGFNLPEVAQSHNTVVVEYYPRLADQGAIGPWAFHRMPFQTFVRVRSGANDRLYGAHNAANKFLRAFDDVGTDDGVAYNGTLKTKAFEFGDPGSTKYLRMLRFLVAGKFNCYIYRDFDSGIYKTLVVDALALTDLWSTSDFWGTGTWGLDSPLKDVKKTNVDAYGRYFTFMFQDAGETATGFQEVPVGATARSLISGEWAIYGMVIDGSMMGVRT